MKTSTKVVLFVVLFVVGLCAEILYSSAQPLPTAAAPKDYTPDYGTSYSPAYPTQSEIENLTESDREQARFSEVMYAQLNADMESGRRASNKMGKHEAPPKVLTWADIPKRPTPIEDTNPWITYHDPQSVTIIDETTAYVDPEVYLADPHYPRGGGRDLCCGGGGVYPPLPPPTDVPEPGELILMATGLLGCLIYRRLKVRPERKDGTST